MITWFFTAGASSSSTSVRWRGPAGLAGVACVLAVLSSMGPSLAGGQTVAVPSEPVTAAPVVDGRLLRTAAEPPDTAVVCPPVFWNAMQLWVAHRQSQGHRVHHISGDQSPRAIRDEIRRVAGLGGLRYVLLVGDAEPGGVRDARVRERCVPTFFAEAKVSTKWGSEPFIPTDNPYADLDGDHVPDVAVGRLSVDTPRELTDVLQKIVRYERSARVGLWRRRIHVFAGVGGFGALADAVVEIAAKKFITDGVPPSYHTSVTYASWRSPYCPDPRQLRQTLQQRIGEGGLCWVYMGHGRATRLDRIQFDAMEYPILEAEDVGKLHSYHGAPIAILLACYTGAYDQPRDCVAEQLLRQPAGPVAVVCGSRVTMPYGMAVLGTALMEGFFDRRERTLGDVFLFAKRALASDDAPDGSNRKLLDSIARTFSPVKDGLQREREEHQQLFQLLGDPLLRIEHPRSLTIDCRRHVESGQMLRVQGDSPIGGKCLVELVCRRDRLTFDAPRRREFDRDPEALAAMHAVYERANDRRWSTRRVDIKPGRFVIELPVPPHAHGSSFVRVFVEAATDFGMGEAPVYIQPSRAENHLRTFNADRQ